MDPKTYTLTSISPSPLPPPTPLPPVVTASGSRENHRRSAGGFSDRRRWAFLYIYFLLPQWKFTSVFSRRYVCVRRAPVVVRVLAIIGRRSRRGKRRRLRRSSKRRRRRIRKNAILIRFERSGRWKFPRSGLCKGKKLRRRVVIGVTCSCMYDVYVYVTYIFIILY